MNAIPMIFVSVPQSKYPKVTRRREFDLISSIMDVYGGSGIKVMTTRTVEQLQYCDSAYFHEKYMNTLECKIHLALCEKYNVVPVVIAKEK